MQKTAIEWVKNPDGSQGYVWNPIKGLCPAECKLPDGKIYCYGRSYYKRFHPEIKTPFLDRNEFDQGKHKKIKGIFVCSTFDLFHPITDSFRSGPILSAYNKTWRDMIFYAIEQTPWHRFYILTKFPENIDRPMPDNVWLGVSITKNEDLQRLTDLCIKNTKIRFVSFEPLLGYIRWDGFRLEFSSLDWIIIGRLTQHGYKYDPKKYWIDKIKFIAGYYGTPLFMKDNLKDIWGEPLIQEFPE